LVDLVALFQDPDAAEDFQAFDGEQSSFQFFIPVGLSISFIGFQVERAVTLSFHGSEPGRFRGKVDENPLGISNPQAQECRDILDG
jgi:hypothetical protein